VNLRPGVVYIDPRVGSKEFERPLYDKYALRVSTKIVLPACDFAFTCGHTRPSPFCDGDYGCRIGIERKTVSDLIGSLMKNRLGGKQVPDMLKYFEQSWILIEGLYRPGEDDSIEVWGYNPKTRQKGWVKARTGLSYSELDRWMIRYDVLGGGRLHRWRVASKIETCAFIADQFRWWEKEWNKHRFNAIDKKAAAPSKVLMWKPNEIETAVAILPGIGVVNAKRVARHFQGHCIEDIMAATPKQWRAAGLNEATARKVYAYIRRRF
jgi:ERCC4-type nuclease